MKWRMKMMNTPNTAPRMKVKRQPMLEETNLPFNKTIVAAAPTAAPIQ